VGEQEQSKRCATTELVATQKGSKQGAQVLAVLALQLANEPVGVGSVLGGQSESYWEWGWR